MILISLSIADSTLLWYIAALVPSDLLAET